MTMLWCHAGHDKTSAGCVINPSPSGLLALAQVQVETPQRTANPVSPTHSSGMGLVTKPSATDVKGLC